jgi:hypothetical protein
MILDEKIIYDKDGNKESVILPYSQYLKLIDLVEENEDVRDYLNIIKKDEELVSYDDALKELDL